MENLGSSILAHITLALLQYYKNSARTFSTQALDTICFRNVSDNKRHISAVADILVFKLLLEAGKW
jgi:hypothetical protein